MLKQIVLKNFKSYRDQALPLASLTLMIGANASGKSNAIEAFRFLSWLSGGERLSVIQQRIDDSNEILRGRAAHLGYFGAPQFSVGCVLSESDLVADRAEFYLKWKRAKSEQERDMLEWGIPPSYSWNQFDVTLSMRGDNLHIVQEKITSLSQNQPLYAVVKPAAMKFSDIEVEYNNFNEGVEDIPRITCTNQIALMCQLDTHVAFYKSHEEAQSEIPNAVRYLRSFLVNTLFLDPIPSLMRGDSYPDKSLRSNCSNLAGVLYSLWQMETNKKAILSFIRSVPESDVSDLLFFPDRRGLISFELVERKLGGSDFKIDFNKINSNLKSSDNESLNLVFDELEFIPSKDFRGLPESIDSSVNTYWSPVFSSVTTDGTMEMVNRGCPAELLSDGTLRVLAIAAAVLSAPQGSTVVLEEVDNGIHPSRAHHLLTTMKNEAKRRNIRLLLTTHNPALMDALPDDALGDVVFCYRDPQEGDSRLVRLGDLDDYAGLITQGPLGELVTNGIIDRFVKSPVTPEAKKKNALDWLARLQGDDAA